MKESNLWIGGAVVVVVLVVGAYLYRSRQAAEAPPEAAPAAAKPVVPEEPAVKHPLPEIPSEQAMPALDDSDASMLSTLAGLFG